MAVIQAPEHAARPGGPGQQQQHDVDRGAGPGPGQGAHCQTSGRADIQLLAKERK